MGLVIGRVGDFSLTAALAFMGIVILTGSFLFRVSEKNELLNHESMQL
jgi:hypothetical protein